MKSSDIIRRIDDLGRIAIPKEVRKCVGLQESGQVKISVEGSKVVFEAYSDLGPYSAQIKELVRSFEGVEQQYAFVTDTEKVLAATLSGYAGLPLSSDLIDAIRNKKDAENIPLLDNKKSATVGYAVIIRDGCCYSLGDGIGAVVLLRQEAPPTEVVKAQARIAADYLGRLINADNDIAMSSGHRRPQEESESDVTNVGKRLNINGIKFDPQKLMPKDELLAFLKERGGSDRDLAKIREANFERFGNELMWLYPISDGKHSGTFIVAVREGFISLPYDAIDHEEYELLELEDAAMFDAESMQVFIDDWRSFSEDLTGAMGDMLCILSGK